MLGSIGAGLTPRSVRRGQAPKAAAERDGAAQTRQIVHGTREIVASTV
jgi:hypothetical protein